MCGLPASLRVMLLGAAGPGEVLLDNRDAIANALDAVADPAAAASPCESGELGTTTLPSDRVDAGREPPDGASFDAGARSRHHTAPSTRGGEGCAAGLPGHARAEAWRAWCVWLLLVLGLRRRR